MDHVGERITFMSKISSRNVPKNQLTKRGTRRENCRLQHREQDVSSLPDRRNVPGLLLKFKIQEVSKYSSGARAFQNFLANLIKVLDRGNVGF